MIIICLLLILHFILSLLLYVLLTDVKGKFIKILLVCALYTALFIIISSYMILVKPADYLVTVSGLLLLSVSMACPSVIAVFYFENTFRRKYEMAEAFLFPLAALPFLVFFIRPELTEGQPLPPDYFHGMLPLVGWIFDIAFRETNLTVSYDTSIITGLISSPGIFFEVLISLFILCIIMRKIKEAYDNVDS